MRGSPLEQKILNLITPVVDDLGYDIVQLRVLGSQKMQTLQILAEDPKTGLLDLKGCEVISRAVSAHLDVEDPIAGAYQLEVSSPGLDRPLTRVKDFENFVGLEANIETEIPAPNGQKKYRGRLKGINDNVINIETDEGMAKIEFDNIAKARLVVNDELLTMKNPKGQKKVLNPKPTKKASNTKSKSEK